MEYGVEQLKELKDPYQALCLDDSLEDSRTSLNALTAQDSEKLAQNIVTCCPEVKLGALGQTIGIFKSAETNQNGFYNYLKKEYFNKAVHFNNPYLMLGTGDALAEYKEELNSLEAQNKKDMATLLVHNCPADKLPTFGTAIEATRVPQSDKDSFHEVLNQAYGIKKRILLLIDVRNPSPHNAVLSKDFEQGVFDSNKDLVGLVLDKNEHAIAYNLVMSTPKENRSEVAKTIANIFPGISVKVQSAFMFRTNIERDLLGDNPQKFFTSKDNTDDICLEFSKVLQKLVLGKEEQIGLKLSTLSQKEKSDINVKLERINPCASDQESMYKLIAKAMNSTESVKSATNTNQEPSTDIRNRKPRNAPSIFESYHENKRNTESEDCGCFSFLFKRH